jgi:caffeoyl-CoA O-methyltransferase
MRYTFRLCLVILAFLPGAILPAEIPGQQPDGATQSRDQQVRAFLESHRRQWRDLNVPESDGRLLHDLVIKHGYKRALEIGTSTGHSGIWIAWALSKTGGKLITVELDENRYRSALANFREAGLSDIIDARLHDAHELVPRLPGSYDFVFCDADKDWYKNYLAAVLPKLDPGGCFAAHNVSQSRYGWSGEYLNYARSQPDLETTVISSSSSGVALSFKKSAK